ncbi:glutamine synthetase [Xylariaceae sp. FL0255]|nr:glutamine synthetase [Xylariaceae sp. FL0255]
MPFTYEDPENYQKLDTFLKEHQYVKLIRLQWIDYSNVLRTRFVPVARCLQIAGGNDQVHLAQNSMLIPISTAPRIFPMSDHYETWTLYPDWSSIRLCGFHPSHATAMSFLNQDESETMFDKCPRALLVETLREAESTWASQVLIGFEIEFVLLDESNNIITPIDRLDGYSRTAGLRAETLGLVEEIVDALEKSSIGIHHFHAEAYDQLEISLAPEPALSAIDSLVLAQETIRIMCVRRKLIATMIPKPTLTGPLTGIHLHLSLSSQHKASKHASATLENSDNFLAGILSHMGSLCAFGMANYDSYIRSISDCAGKWIGWGTDNRDLPVRKVSDSHWEFRMMDSTANAYLFASALLLAAKDGIENDIEMAWKNCNFFPDLLDADGRAFYGLGECMPASLKEALECLISDAGLRRRIPDDLLKWFLSVKDKEVEEFAKMSDDQRRLRFLKYF